MTLSIRWIWSGYTPSFMSLIFNRWPCKRWTENKASFFLTARFTRFCRRNLIRSPWPRRFVEDRAQPLFVMPQTKTIFLCELRDLCLSIFLVLRPDACKSSSYTAQCGCPRSCNSCSIWSASLLTIEQKLGQPNFPNTRAYRQLFS